MKVKNLIGVMVLVLLSLVSLQAGVIPGRWEKLDGQPSGTRMLVTLNSGERMDCALSSSGALDLTVTDQTGTERVLPKSEVRKIVSATREVRDNVMKGTLIGAIVGGLAVLPFAAIIENETGQRDAMMTVVGYAGIGAGIGAAVDWAIKEKEVLYRQWRRVVAAEGPAQGLPVSRSPGAALPSSCGFLLSLFPLMRQGESDVAVAGGGSHLAPPRGDDDVLATAN